MRDLDETLLALRNITSSTGYIFLEVPNTEHFYWELPLGDLPHIQFFTKKSLILAFHKYNFDCIEIGEYGLTYIEEKNRIPLSPDRYGACDKGFWLRALFRKVG